MLRNKIKVFLKKNRIEYVDLGPEKFDKNDDYPDFAFKVALKVATRPEKDVGILICRSGQGMCAAANKIKGIRAVSAWNKKLASSTRRHDFANILCLASEHIKFSQIQEIIRVFIQTPFSKERRHKRRIEKIKKIENNSLCHK